LTVALARKGVTVYGYDKNPDTVATLAAGRPHLFEPGIAEGLRAFLGGTIHIADRPPSETVDAAIICVSTPVVAATHMPDLDNLRAAARADPRGECRLPTARSGAARIRGRRLPVEGPLHPDRELYCRRLRAVARRAGQGSERIPAAPRGAALRRADPGNSRRGRRRSS